MTFLYGDPSATSENFRYVFVIQGRKKY